MENILENGNIAFHGINYDYFKMMSILKYGILSQKAAENNGLTINRNYGGYNGNSQVSLSESPSIHGTYNHGAFNVFVKNGISFVIDVSDLHCIPDNKSGIPGEVYVDYAIPIEKILGIMIPESAAQATIDKLNIFGDMGTGYVNNYALNFVDMVNSFFEMNFDKNEILKLIEAKNNLSGDYFDRSKQENLINQQINTTITKMFDLGFRKKYNYSESPTLVETITVLTGGNIPIYTTNGELLSKEVNKSF